MANSQQLSSGDVVRLRQALQRGVAYSYTISTTSLTTGSSGSFVGKTALGNGVSSGSVTGLGLAFTPANVFLQVSRPPGGLNITALLNSGTLTQDGFAFELSAATDSVNYVLSYFIL